MAGIDQVLDHATTRSIVKAGSPVYGNLNNDTFTTKTGSSTIISCKSKGGASGYGQTQSISNNDNQGEGNS